MHFSKPPILPTFPPYLLLIQPREPTTVTSSPPSTALQSPSKVSGGITSNTSPYFSEPTESLQSNGGGSPGISRPLLEYVFLAMAALIVSSILIRRLLHAASYRYPRLRGIAPFPHRPPQDSVLPSQRPPYPRTHGLNNVPSYPYPTFQGRRVRARTRGADIDSGGRRQGIQSDYHGPLTDKDMLPAYDIAGGPPKYVELERLGILYETGDTTAPPVPAVDDNNEALSDPRVEGGDVVNESEVSTGLATVDGRTRNESGIPSSPVISDRLGAPDSESGLQPVLPANAS